ncbi:Putative periplasmic protein [hydrothermal vent metagenome]|uniref:Putative periplasmic protein n=1 Tax=hydrothermal vent metagenome TaxID=652676 RepID=A0A1W1E9K4_9ZZZZ
MAENTNRSVFGLNGVTGMLIATVLLLSILAFLTVWGMGVQQKSATNPYDPTPIVGSLDNVKMISKDNAKFAFKDAK